MKFPLAVLPLRFASMLAALELSERLDAGQASLADAEKTIHNLFFRFNNNDSDTSSSLLLLPIDDSQDPAPNYYRGFEVATLNMLKDSLKSLINEQLNEKKKFRTRIEFACRIPKIIPTLLYDKINKQISPKPHKLPNNDIKYRGNRFPLL
jgi:hypothetical protein